MTADTASEIRAALVGIRVAFDQRHAVVDFTQARIPPSLDVCAFFIQACQDFVFDGGKLAYAIDSTSQAWFEVRMQRFGLVGPKSLGEVFEDDDQAADSLVAQENDAHDSPSAMH